MARSDGSSGTLAGVLAETYVPEIAGRGDDGATVRNLLDMRTCVRFSEEYSDREWNPTDYAYHLNRRARGLPLWFSLAVNGIQAYRDGIEVAAAVRSRGHVTSR